MYESMMLVHVNQGFASEQLSVSNHPAYDGHEQVVCGSDAASGMRAIIAVHSTRRGPALGGCRMWPYEDTNEALTDVLRLSQGMSYKHAMADIGRGGGKAVIFGDPRRDKTPELLQAFGKFVDEFAGRYITAEDVGMSAEDLVLISEYTEHVAGLPTEFGGSGDPSPFTALGVLHGIVSAVAFRAGIAAPVRFSLMDHQFVEPPQVLEGVRIAVQGVGQVGGELCRFLKQVGAELIVTDVRDAYVARVCDRFGATAVRPDAIYDVEADVFAPCALGSVLSPSSVNRLKAGIVAGSANNQLASPDVAHLLHDCGILYAPDYVINAGGVINISYERETYDNARAAAHVSRIGEQLTDIFHRARLEDTNTAAIADEIAQRKLQAAEADV
jgi:leucine dehydrogenase